MEIATVSPQRAAFLAGISILSYFFIVKWFTISPMIHVIPQGKIRNPAAQVNFSSAPVTSFL